MRVDDPPPAHSRPLRIKKKAKPGNVPPASATTAPVGDGAQAPTPLATKMHAWQQVNQVRKDLSEMHRPRGTHEKIDAVRMYAEPTDPAVAGPVIQRGSNTQRGSTPKFTPTTSLAASNVARDDMAHAPDAPTGNAVTDAPIPGRPQQAPPLAALGVGTGLWNASIQCHLVRMRDPALHAPPATLFGTVFTAYLMTFEYGPAPDDGPTGMGSGPKILIQPMQGGGDPTQPGLHSYTIHGHDIDFIYVSHPSSFPGRISIVRKRFRADATGVIQVDVPPGSGTAIANFMHVFHNLPGHTPNKAPLPDLAVMAEDTAVAGVYTASFWGEDDWAIQSPNSNGPSAPRAARSIQQSNQRACFKVTGDAHAGTTAPCPSAGSSSTPCAMPDAAPDDDARDDDDDFGDSGAPRADGRADAGADAAPDDAPVTGHASALLVLGNKMQKNAVFLPGRQPIFLLVPLK